jgi:hypothetical protein
VARRAIVRLLLLLVSLTLFLGTGEVALRIVYRDGGRATLSGPGGLPFDHLTTEDQRRGRLDRGPRKADTPRIIVIGDSITYGLGVHDWRDTWPEVLARKFEAAGQPIEMAVLAVPGRDITQHVDELTAWGAGLPSDVLIYQWYINDIEVVYHRPEELLGWETGIAHKWLRANSYLYFFVDHLLAGRLRADAYLNYIVNDFRPGTVEWVEFERYFHTFATLAQATAKKRLLMLYPQVPFRGTYALQPAHDRMHAIAGAHTLALPPAAWTRAAGSLIADTAAPWQQVIAIRSGYAGIVADTKEYLFAPGALDLTLTLSLTSSDRASHVGTFELVDAASNQTLASQELDARPSPGLQKIHLRMVVPGEGRRRVLCRVRSSGESAWSLADLGVAVDYGMTVLDLTGPLNTFNTHASIFDSHPNEAAHRVMAEQVYSALQRQGLVLRFKSSGIP